MLHPKHTTRRAFTFVELTLSLALSTIVLVSLGSMVVIGSRAVPDGTEPIGDEVHVTRIAEIMREDLMFATRVTYTGNHNAKQDAWVELVVPDATGDGAPDTVRYEYDAGAFTITRTVNGSTPVLSVFSVEGCSADYEHDDGVAELVVIRFNTENEAKQLELTVEFINTPEISS